MIEPDLSTHFDLHVSRGFFDAETCVEIITEMRRSPASPAITYGQGQAGSVNPRVRNVTQLKPSQTTVDYVTGRLADYRVRLEEHFGLALNSCEDPQFLCYRVGDFFVAHQDGNTGLVRLATDQSRRISVSLFLNSQTEAPETESYCGGSLVFLDWRHSKELSLGGEAGTLVAFRSETTHEVIPVTHGERYSIVSWYG